MTDELTSNVEPFTPEVVARRTIELYGDEASIQAAMNADHFYAENKNHIGKIWHEVVKIIEAVRLVKESAGGSLNDYIGEGSGRNRTDF